MFSLAVHFELAAHYLQGVNIMAFCKEYNAATQDKVGTVIPVEITVFEVSQCSHAACHSIGASTSGFLYAHVQGKHLQGLLGRPIYGFVLLCGCSSKCNAGS